MTDRTRRSFLQSLPAAAGAASVFGFVTPALWAAGQEPTEAPPASFPRQDADSVREIVAVSHGQLDRVEALVAKRPELAKASWDWGFGDWESALGAASHTGQRAIAEILMAHGARPTIFTFAMLGKLEVVRALVTGHPGIQRTPGPHGITLLQHARVSAERNEDAATTATVDYLTSLGDADPVPPSLEVSDDAYAAYVGAYRFGPGPDDVLAVERDRRGWLTITHPNARARRLHRVEAAGFAPVGAPSVRLRFDVVRGRAVSLTVHNPIPLAQGIRTEG